MFNLFKKKATEVSKTKSAITSISQNNTTATNSNQNASKVAKPSLIKSPSIMDEDVEEDEDELDYDYTGTVRTLDLKVEIGGTKGWPTDTSIVFYHKLEGLICVGTLGGSIYVYGDGFQIMRPWFTIEPNEVTHILPLFPDQILVCYADNSILVFELPSLNLVAQLGSKWLNTKFGNITTIYVDEPSQLNFTYVGTSEGNIFILDISVKGIRVCDYTLHWKMLGLKASYAVSAIAICPKDEKYIAISFDALLNPSGHVCIFDLVKQKPVRSYDTNHGIVSIAWQHQGEILYAATKSGKIVCYGIDRTSESLASQWRVDEEIVDAENDGNESVMIHKIQWLPPQPPSEEGCLFILLGSSNADNDDLKSVIVGLSPQNGNLSDLQLVFALPPISFEKIVGFEIVSSYEASSDQGLASIPTDDSNIAVGDIIPALLIVTQKPNDYDDTVFMKHLKVIRCPAIEMSHWALEVGTLPDPRKANEVLCSVSKITCMIGFVQEDSGLSLALALLTKSIENEGTIVKTRKSKAYDSDEETSTDAPTTSSNQSHTHISKAIHSNNDQQIRGKRLSARDFLASCQIKDLEHQFGDYDCGDKWQMVLASGVHQDNLYPGRKPIPRLQDIIIHGHEDGSIIAWGVSLPQSSNTDDKGKGSMWLPLASLRCGTTPITTITEDESTGLLLAADEAGNIVLWEIICDNQYKALSILQEMKTQIITSSKRIATENIKNNQNNSNDDEEDDNILIESNTSKNGTKYLKYASYTFDNIREVVRTNINRPISASLLLSAFLQVFIGTSDGKLYSCNLPSNQFKEIVHIHKPPAFSTAGGIVSLAFGYFYHSESLNVPCVYVAYKNGLVTAVQINTLQLIGYSNRCKPDMLADIIDTDDDDAVNDEHNSSSNTKMPEICITNAFYDKLLLPSLEDVSILFAEDQINNILNLTTPTKISDNSIDGRERSASSFVSSVFRTTSNATNENKFDLLNKMDINTRKKINPRSIPKYLMIVRGKYLLTYDLNKFKRTSTHLPLPGSQGHGIHAKMISQKTIITYKFVTLLKGNNINNDDSDDENHLSNQSKLCIMDINSNGIYALIAAKEKAPYGHHNLLEGIVDYKCDLKFGCILPNGTCYLNDSDMVIYNIATSVNHSMLTFMYKQPDRATPDSAPPNHSLILLNGREELLAVKKASLTKRRASVIKLTAAPTDLTKLFRKSFDQKQKEDLTNQFDSDDESDTRSPSSTTSRTSNVASKTLNTMNETYQALQERGDRINKLALQSDDLSNNAQVFRDTAIKQKEILKKRNTKWGFF